MTTMRIVDRVVSGVVALALLVGGLLVAVEIAAQELGREEPWILPWDTWYRKGVETLWSDDVVRGVSLGLVVLALLLLWLQLAPRKPAAVALQDRTPDVDVTLDRRGYESWLGARLSRVDGVGSARVRASRKKIAVKAEALARQTQPVEQRLRQAVDAELHAMELETWPSVKVDVTSRRDR